MTTHYKRINISLDPALLARFKAAWQRKGMHVSTRLAALMTQDLAKDKTPVSRP